MRLVLIFIPLYLCFHVWSPFTLPKYEVCSNKRWYISRATFDFIWFFLQLCWYTYSQHLLTSLVILHFNLFLTDKKVECGLVVLCDFRLSKKLDQRIWIKLCVKNNSWVHFIYKWYKFCIEGREDGNNDCQSEH